MLIFFMYTMRKKVILVLNKGPREELDDAAITTEAKYSVNITKLRKNVFSVYTTMQPTVFGMFKV